MKKNVGIIDRLIRIAVGINITSMVFIAPSSPLAMIGLAPLLTGIIAWCPLYILLGISTCGKCDSGTGCCSSWENFSGKGSIWKACRTVCLFTFGWSILRLNCREKEKLRIHGDFFLHAKKMLLSPPGEGREKVSVSGGLPFSSEVVKFLKNLFGQDFFDLVIDFFRST